MAKDTTTFCVICGALVGPGIKYCCHFCKQTAKNDKALVKAKSRSAKKATTKKPKTKKAK